MLYIIYIYIYIRNIHISKSAHIIKRISRISWLLPLGHRTPRVGQWTMVGLKAQLCFASTLRQLGSPTGWYNNAIYIPGYVTVCV